MPLSHRRFDQVGPLARSVADIILFDSVVTGEHSAVSATPLEGVRIGTSEYLMQGIDAECGRIVAAAIERLEAAGAQIVPVELPASLAGGRGRGAPFAQSTSCCRACRAFWPRRGREYPSMSWCPRRAPISKGS